jgi:uncharacterized protein (TIGR03067 family)
MKARLFLLLAAVLLAPGCSKKDENQKELERFQGTWRYESIESDGETIPAETFKDWRLVKEGDRYTFTQGDAVYKGTFKVDVSKTPKTIDITRTEGPEGGMKSAGIYELDGDTYKVCLAPPGKDRPTAFESKAGSGYVLQVLKREKK